MNNKRLTGRVLATVLAVLFVMAIAVVFYFTETKGTSDKNQSDADGKDDQAENQPESETETEEWPLAGENTDDTDEEVFLSAIPLGDGTVIRIYASIFHEDDMVPPVLTRMDCYDLIHEEILSEKDLTEYEISAAVVICTGRVGDGFYIRAQFSDELYLFDKDCVLIEKMILPEDALDQFGSITAFAISDDWSALVYQSQQYDEDAGHSLILLDLEDGSSEEIYREHEEPSESVDFTELYFSDDKSSIGFAGQVYLEDGETSQDCYGYLETDSRKLHLTIEEGICTASSGNSMYIYEQFFDYGENGRGYVDVMDLRNGDMVRYRTEDLDESASVSVVDEHTFLTVMNMEDVDGSVTNQIRVYTDGIKTGEICYADEEEASTNIWDLAYDTETEILFVQYYADRLLSYQTVMLPLD